MILSDKRVLIISGHYGCGKTNLAVNLALLLAKNGDRVRLVDLDIVNPYFRSSDSRALLNDAGVEVIAPQYAGTNLDIPALPPQNYAAFEDKSSRVVVDVGGDDAGAAALGRYAQLIKSEDNFEQYYVLNARRVLTQKPEEALAILREIETAGHLPITALINNTNLAGETDAEIVRKSADFANAVSRLAALPVAFTSVREKTAGELADMPNILPVKIYVRTIWDEKT
jgi:hypothetical protein